MGCDKWHGVVVHGSRKIKRMRIVGEYERAGACMQLPKGKKPG